jgi:hypothetical protein
MLDRSQVKAIVRVQRWQEGVLAGDVSSQIPVEKRAARLVLRFLYRRQSSRCGAGHNDPYTDICLLADRMLIRSYGCAIATPTPSASFQVGIDGVGAL